MSSFPYSIADLRRMGRENEPDLNLAFDMAQLATDNARESISLVAARCSHPMDMGMVVMLAALNLYHHSRQAVEKMEPTDVPRLAFEGMDAILRANSEEEAIAAKDKFSKIMDDAKAAKKKGPKHDQP